MSIIFMTCIWCDERVESPGASVSLDTTIGHVSGLVCEKCVDLFNNLPEEEDQ